LGIEIISKSLCQTEWKYIPFSFNEKDIESAKQISQDLGVDKFYVNPSDRFDHETDFLKPNTDLLGPNYQAQLSWKSDPNNNQTLNPKCRAGNEHFITADGFYSPCCFLADHRFYYKTPFGKQKKLYNIKNQTLSQILQESTVVKFYQNLEQQPGCQFNCPG
jgi:hypothetical protein